MIKNKCKFESEFVKNIKVLIHKMYDVIHRFLYKYLYSTMYTICVYYAYSFLFIFFTDGADETV